MRLPLRTAILVAVALAVTYAVASPFITVYQMRTAAQERDGEALATHIDFPSVRDDLKDQLNARIAREAASRSEDEWLGSLGGMLAGLVVGKAVDVLVTPSAVIQLMKGDVPSFNAPRGDSGGQAGSEPRDKPFGDASYRYDAWDKFSVVVPERDGRELRFILRRQGLGWRLTAIKIPM